MIIVDILVILCASGFTYLKVREFLWLKRTLEKIKTDQRQLLNYQMEKELFPEIKQITPTRKKIQSYALLGREVYRREEQ